MFESWRPSAKAQNQLLSGPPYWSFCQTKWLENDPVNDKALLANWALESHLKMDSSSSETNPWPPGSIIMELFGLEGTWPGSFSPFPCIALGSSSLFQTTCNKEFPPLAQNSSRDGNSPFFGSSFPCFACSLVLHNPWFGFSFSFFFLTSSSSEPMFSLP